MRRTWLAVLFGLIVAWLPAMLGAASLDQLNAKTFAQRQAAFGEFVKAAKEDKALLQELIKGVADQRLLVRMYSAKALGQIGDASAFEALRKAATTDKNAAIRAEAALAMGSIQTNDCAEALLKIVGMRSKSGDAVRYVRLCAAQALCRFRRNDTVPILIALLKHPDDGIPPVAAKALAELTYFHFGADYKKWKTWWQDNKDTFVVTQTVYPHHPLEKKQP